MARSAFQKTYGCDKIYIYTFMSDTWKMEKDGRDSGKADLVFDISITLQPSALRSSA